jgi:FMN phosphatase YigB (HAD superfamily)
MIRTIVFDFGNVVAFFDHSRALKQLAPFTDMDPVELALVLYGSPIEDAYERGAIPTDEYVREAMLNGRLTCSPDEFLAHYCDIFWPNPEVIDLLPRLKPRYRLVLASNTNDAHFTKYTFQFAREMARLDHIVTSPMARARKPEPVFFAFAQRHTDAEPGECLFIDDLPVNVEAAQRFGWKGLVYRADGTLVEKLRAAGVEIA